MRFGRLMVIGIVGVLGCGGELEAGDIDDSSDALTAKNGVLFNGVKFNGVKFNGVKFNGVKFNGVKFNGVKFNGSMLEGTTSTGQFKTGTAMKGVTMTGYLQNGTTLEIKIADAKPSAMDSEIYHYWLVKAGTTTGLCPNSGPAIAVAGWWNETTGAKNAAPDLISFGCAGVGAIAKCVEMKYKPWKSTTLEQYHRACVRMVRGDFCGTGAPYTVEGQAINVWDRLNLQVRAPDDTKNGVLWGVEAQWGVNGAVCMNPIATTRDNDLSGNIPPCYSQRTIPSCGYRWSTSALMTDAINVAR